VRNLLTHCTVTLSFAARGRLIIIDQQHPIFALVLAHTVLTMSPSNDNVYESQQSLNEYLDLHYSNALRNLPPTMDHALFFPQRVGQLLIKLCDTYESALDIGGSVGGTALELANNFDHVDSFDFSHQFIETAQRLQQGESLEFQVRTEGDATTTATVPSFSDHLKNKIRFFQGDACQMPSIPELSGKTYNAIVLANLLCRLPNPQACLTSVASLLQTGGVVLIVTPFTWLEHYTPREHWIIESGDSLTSLQQRMQALGFQQIHDEDMPLLIREHTRKYQYIISKATWWKKL
jgi:putative 4-mercaptohistidine N1-methyltranferase